MISGEDISGYRRSSKRIFELINVAVNGNSNLGRANVERLGFDELFIDATEIVRRHLDSTGYDVEIGSRTVLNLFPDLQNTVDETHEPDLDGWDPTQVVYPFGVFEGNIVGLADDAHNSHTRSRQHLLLAAASHLAKHLRQILYKRLGYTCSVGVSTNKLLAKLVAGKQKPNGQSLLLPSFESSFIKDFPLHKITGIGLENAV